jgi:hypothetical protein
VAFRDDAGVLPRKHSAVRWVSSSRTGDCYGSHEGALGQGGVRSRFVATCFLSRASRLGQAGIRGRPRWEVLACLPVLGAPGPPRPRPAQAESIAAANRSPCSAAEQVQYGEWISRIQPDVKPRMVCPHTRSAKSPPGHFLEISGPFPGFPEPRPSRSRISLCGCLRDRPAETEHHRSAQLHRHAGTLAITPSGMISASPSTPRLAHAPLFEGSPGEVPRS